MFTNLDLACNDLGQFDGIWRGCSSRGCRRIRSSIAGLHPHPADCHGSHSTGPHDICIHHGGLVAKPAVSCIWRRRVAHVVLQYTPQKAVVGSGKI